MKSRHNGSRIHTTLGELIAAISDVAFEYSDDAKEAYELAHLVLVDMVKTASCRGGTVGGYFPKRKYLH